MIKIATKSKWKSVKLDPNLAAKGFSDGLLGIEQLTDYKIVKAKKNRQPSKESTSENEIRPTKKMKKKAATKRPQVTKEDGSPPKKVTKTFSEPPAKVKVTVKAKAQTKAKSKAKPKAKSKVKKDEIDDGATPQVRDMSGWDGLFVHDLVLQGLEAEGFTHPTEIQREVLPAAIKGKKDVVGAAETGSGKTLAFAIPILNGILKDRDVYEEDEDGNEGDEMNTDDVSESSDEEDFSDSEITGTGCVKVVNDVEFDFDETEMPTAVEMLNGRPGSGRLKALILTPTRELAIQVKNHILAAAKFTGIKVAAVVGGMSSQKQLRLLSKRPEIVVATPGRLWDLIQDGDTHLAGAKEGLDFLAIDETDRMAEKGHFEELTKILAFLNDGEQKKRQTFVFSATMSLVHDVSRMKKTKKTPEQKVEEIVKLVGIEGRPKVVDLTRKFSHSGHNRKEDGLNTVPETLLESRIQCKTDEKDFYLYYLLTQHPGRTIVFCNSIDCVRRLVNLFGYLGVRPLGLHAQMQQRQRLKNLDRFSSDGGSVLVATDVAARGLDIKDISHVVHYQTPRTAENYIHRSGRTARANREGISVMLVDPSENYNYKKLCKTLGRSEDLPDFPIDSQVFPKIKQRVQAARQLDKALLKNKKEDLGESWFKRAAREADLNVSDEDMDEEEEEGRQANKASEKAKIKAMREELDILLATPLTQVGFSGKYLTMTGRLELPADLKARSTQSAIEKLTDATGKDKKVAKKKTSFSQIRAKRTKRKQKSHSKKIAA